MSGKSPYARGTAPIIKDTYQLGDTLGKGAYGIVFRGLNIKTGEVVAIKQINKGLIRDDQMPQMTQELEMLQNLFHQNIVQFIDYCDNQDYLYFILEYVEGGNLHDTMVKFGNLPESLLQIYVTQVLRGLSYLHDQGVIHRDIKGANILLTKEGTCKLADFGSCSYAAVVSTTDSLVGTPFWMAPEIISKEEASHGADIWSLGCTILELLTGQAPYWKFGADVALFRMVNDQHPPLPKLISANLEAFLKACFIRDATQRPTASSLLKYDWITSLWRHDDDPPPAPSSSRPSKTMREPRGKSRTVSIPRIWANSRGSTQKSPRSNNSPNSESVPAQELETVWRKIRGGTQSDPRKKPAGAQNKLNKKEIKQLEEMDLSPAQFTEFLSWWKEWEQGANKTRSAAEATKKLSKKEKKDKNKKEKEVMREAMAKKRKEVAAAAAAAATQRSQKREAVVDHKDADEEDGDKGDSSKTKSHEDESGDITDGETEDVAALAKKVLALYQENRTLAETHMPQIQSAIAVETLQAEELQKGLVALKEQLTKLTAEKESLQAKVFFLKEMAADAQGENASLFDEIKNLVASLAEKVGGDVIKAKPSDYSVTWMVPGAKCQAYSTKDGSWHDGVILSLDTVETAGKLKVTYNVVFMDSGAEEELKVRYIKAPRADGWAGQVYERKNSVESREEAALHNSNGLGNGETLRRKRYKGASFLPWKKE